MKKAIAQRFGETPVGTNLAVYRVFTVEERAPKMFNCEGCAFCGEFCSDIPCSSRDRCDGKDAVYIERDCSDMTMVTSEFLKDVAARLERQDPKDMRMLISEFLCMASACGPHQPGVSHE